MSDDPYAPPPEGTPGVPPPPPGPDMSAWPAPTPTGDVLLAGPPPPPASRRTPVLVAVVVVAVLLATVAGAVLAVRWWKGSSPALADWLPADVTTVAAVDLDPSGQQKTDAVRLLTRLPKGVLDGADDTEQAGASLVAQVLSGVVDVPEETVSASSSSWFGGQLAVATRDLVPVLDSSSPPGAVDGRAGQLVVLTVKDQSAFDAAWAQWGQEGRSPRAATVARDGVVVVGDGRLDGVPGASDPSLADSEGFTATASVREGALAWLWTLSGEAAAFPAPGGRQTIAAGLRVRSDGLEVVATVLGLTPKADGAAPPVATGGDVAVAFSMAPMAGALQSASDAYDWNLDPSEEQTGQLLDLLGGTVSMAAFVPADGSLGAALDLVGGGQGLADLRDQLGAAAEELRDDSGLDVGGADPVELLDALTVQGDTATVRYRVPPGTSAIGTAGSQAVPDQAAALQAYVSVPTLLRASGVRDAVPSDDDTTTLLDAVDTVGISVAMPEDGRADVAVRVLLKP